jgi:hypothetical protein
MRKVLILSLLILCFKNYAQPNEKQLGAWYMLFWDWNPEKSAFGLQGDYQLRNWNLGGDLEQLLLRTGVTYRPKNAIIKFTLGYGHITTGAFRIDNTDKTFENRIYQEAIFPSKIGERFNLTHRFRYEQRFVEDQDFRSRYRYNLFLNVPLNSVQMEKSTLYLALYNELFINGERNLGQGRQVEIFDRSRTYGALGYYLNNTSKIQLGAMHQITNGWEKTQLQLSFHWQL